MRISVRRLFYFSFFSNEERTIDVDARDTVPGTRRRAIAFAQHDDFMIYESYYDSE